MMGNRASRSPDRPAIDPKGSRCDLVWTPLNPWDCRLEPLATPEARVATFDSKIAIVLRSDLATWQALNVTAFLTSGLAAAYPEMIGAPYRNACGHTFLALSVQPVIVLTGDLDLLRRIHKRAIERDVKGAGKHP
jgi:hypothetical protein